MNMSKLTVTEPLKPSAPKGSSRAYDPQWFREVLGHFPTGVCVVTASDPEGGHAGMAVGSFTSVSLEPPLVAFLADKSSTSWPRIRRAGSFCVNVLASDQQHLCRAFATKGGDKFQGFSVQLAGSGSPIFDGVVAWIDCDIEAVHEAGDHYIVIGKVLDLDVPDSSLPLLFFQGGYGRFTPQSLVTADLKLLEHFRDVDVIRPELEALARETRLEVNACVRTSDEVVVIATAGQPRGAHISTRVGHRFAFVPPTGAVLVSWADEETVRAWLSRAPNGSDDENRDGLEWIRHHGYSMIAGSIEHDADTDDPGGRGPRELRRVVRSLRMAFALDDLADLERDRFWAAMSAPVFDGGGNASLLVSLTGFDEPLDADDIELYSKRLLRATTRITELVGGRPRTPAK
jgi:flavin reductase (DIM6/NTAB) family NADH-FMN oxidoreductase RutF